MPSQLLAIRPRQCSRFLCRRRRLFCCFWRMLRRRRRGQFRAEARIRQTIFTCYLLLLLLAGIAGIFPAACRRMPRKACRGQVRCRNSNNIKHNIAHVQFRRTIFLKNLKDSLPAQARKSGRGIIRGRCTGALKLLCRCDERARVLRKGRPAGAAAGRRFKFRNGGRRSA